MEQVAQEGCQLEWGSDPSLTVRLVQVLMAHLALVSAALMGLLPDQTWIPVQPLVMVACHMHSNNEVVILMTPTSAMLYCK